MNFEKEKKKKKISVALLFLVVLNHFIMLEITKKAKH